MYDATSLWILCYARISVFLILSSCYLLNVVIIATYASLAMLSLYAQVPGVIATIIATTILTIIIIAHAIVLLKNNINDP